MGNFYTDLRHHEKPVTNNQIRSKIVPEPEDRLNEIEHQVNRLLLINAALYDVIKEKLGVTDEEINRKIKELDDKDLLIETKIDPPPVRKCRKCGKNLIQRRTMCVYCGTENELKQ